MSVPGCPYFLPLYPQEAFRKILFDFSHNLEVWTEKQKETSKEGCRCFMIDIERMLSNSEKAGKQGGSIMEYITLNNGIKMPILGYGVYQISGEECERCVLDAIETGYRSIDTAQSYGNEEAVGRAVKKCGISREDLFLTTKVWITNGGYEKAKVSLRESLEKLQTEYIDLVLIHQPFNDYYGTYRAMEEAYKEGWIRAIGVSNFYPDRLVDLCSFAEIKPAVNQVETHVFQQQKTAHEYMEKYGVQHESWGPFAEGRKDFFTNPVLIEIGKKSGADGAPLPDPERDSRDPEVRPQRAYAAEYRRV